MAAEATASDPAGHEARQRAYQKHNSAVASTARGWGDTPFVTTGDDVHPHRAIAFLACGKHCRCGECQGATSRASCTFVFEASATEIKDVTALIVRGLNELEGIDDEQSVVNLFVIRESAAPPMEPAPSLVLGTKPSLVMSYFLPRAYIAAAPHYEKIFADEPPDAWLLCAINGTRLWSSSVADDEESPPALREICDFEG